MRYHIWILDTQGGLTSYRSNSLPDEEALCTWFGHLVWCRITPLLAGSVRIRQAESRTTL
jgi:hypothetical protein